MWQRLKESKLFQRLISFGGLFTSFGTLLCCAIPSALVLMGFGATVAGFLGEFPQLIWLSENKGLVFGISFFMLGLSFAVQRWVAAQSCPLDKRQECETTKSWAKPLLLITLLINCIGAFYAFILPTLL
jgi:hypothetical protein